MRTTLALACWLLTISVARSAPSFADFDRNQNGTVSEAEFLAHGPESAAVWKRDFHLSDWNGDGALSPAEFAGCPTIFPATDRGPWPDPLDDMRQKYVDLLDQHWNTWDTNKNGQISHGEFISGTLPLAVTPLKTAAVNACDPNGDGIVSRDEVRGVIERMLGYRAWNDLPLRQSNGCLTNGSLFRSLDRNDDGSLFPTEMQAVALPNSTAQQTWRILDADRDGKVEFVEWHKAEQFSVFDPISEFRRMDANLDARLDSDELRAVPESHRLLAAFLLPGFDHDHDGGLSLAEFRVCPLGNPVLNWHCELSDQNNDGQLVFEEFQFGRGQYRLLAWEYFHRFDWNQDRVLDTNEFSFRTKQPDAIYTVSEDGAGWKLWWRPASHHALDSLAMSPDGKQLAVSRLNVGIKHGELTNHHLVLIDCELRTFRNLRPGQMPSWSPDGKYLLCRHGGGQGLGVELSIVALSGEVQQTLGRGWCAEWSPDGQRIAYSNSSQLWTYDLVTHERSPLIVDDERNPYRAINEHLAWSPDSRRVCFRGTKDRNLQDIVTVHVGGAELGYRIHDTCDIRTGRIAWHPRGDRIVFSKLCPERERVQLYEFDPDRNDPPRLFPGQDHLRNNTDMCWTLDGTTLFVISGDF